MFCASAVASLSSPVAQQRCCAARCCGSDRLSDVIGRSLTFIGIPLSLSQAKGEEWAVRQLVCHAGVVNRKCVPQRAQFGGSMSDSKV